MKLFATIPICAWVLWLVSSHSYGTFISTLVGYPTSAHEVCMANAKRLVGEKEESFTEVYPKTVNRSSTGGEESLFVKLENGFHRWSYLCLPDTIDPREKPEAKPQAKPRPKR
jgi:hypothetical protein